MNAADLKAIRAYAAATRDRDGSRGNAPAEAAIASAELTRAVRGRREPKEPADLDAGRGPMHAVLPWPPGVNHLYATVRGRRVKSREARVYCAAANVAARETMRPLLGPVALTLTFYRPRRGIDLDGRLKALLDALSGAAYVDDRQVFEIHAAQTDDDPKNPRVEVVARPHRPEAYCA